MRLVLISRGMQLIYVIGDALIDTVALVCSRVGLIL